MKLLSKMNRDELWDFWVKYGRCGRKDAEALLGRKYKGYTKEARALASYACNKAVAIDCARRKDTWGTKTYRKCAELCLEGLSLQALQLVYDGTGR